MDKNWFTERIGTTIIRTNTYDNTETEWEVTEQNAGYLWLFTEKGYTFREGTLAENATVSEMETVDNDDWLSAVPTPRRLVVHSGPPESLCVSCEG